MSRLGRRAAVTIGRPPAASDKPRGWFATSRAGVQPEYNCTPTGRSVAWLSRLTGGQEIGGSNPPVPTRFPPPLSKSPHRPNGISADPAQLSRLTFSLHPLVGAAAVSPASAVRCCGDVDIDGGGAAATTESWRIREKDVRGRREKCRGAISLLSQDSPCGV